MVGWVVRMSILRSKSLGITVSYHGFNFYNIMIMRLHIIKSLINPVYNHSPLTSVQFCNELESGK